MTYQHRRPLLGYFVSAYSAAWLDYQMRKVLPEQLEYLRRNGNTASADSLEMTMAGITMAAQAYRDRIAETSDAPAVIAPTEHSESPADAEPMLSTKDTAGLLGVSDRQIRKLLATGALAGSTCAGRWLITAASVEDYKLRKDAA